MEIQITHGNEMVVALSGRLDTTTSIELSKRLEAEEINEPLVIFDLKETEYISSAGLRLLLYWKKELAKTKKTIEIHNLNSVCQEVFKVTGFGNILNVK